MTRLGDRLAELDVLLNNLDNESWGKIPSDVLEKIKENKNVNYKWDYDDGVAFEDHNINNDTLILFLLIVYKYIANDEEKEEIDDILKSNSIEYDKTYSADIFTSEMPSQDAEIHESDEKEEDNKLIEQKDTFLLKIKHFIMKLFNKN